MPYVSNDGVRIHYHVEGEGPPLVLQHAFMGSLEDWRDLGYVEALKSEYQLILIDARGHGNSDKPRDAESYELELRVGDIVAVMDDLKINKAHYFGYSMGGWIGFGIGKYAPQRFHSLVIGGAHPYAQSFEAFREGLGKGLDAFVDSMEDLLGPLPAESRTRLLANDVQALIALQQDRPDMDDVLPGMIMPCLVYGGDADPIYPEVKRGAEQLGMGTFFSLTGLNHVQAMGRSDLVLPYVKQFLQQTSP